VRCCALTSPHWQTQSQSSELMAAVDLAAWRNPRQPVEGAQKARGAVNMILRVFASAGAPQTKLNKERLIYTQLNVRASSLRDTQRDVRRRHCLHALTLNKLAGCCCHCGGEQLSFCTLVKLLSLSLRLLLCMLYSYVDARRVCGFERAAIYPRLPLSAHSGAAAF